MTTNRTFRIAAKLAVAGAISVVGLTATSTAAQAGPACSDGNIIIAKAGKVTVGTECDDKIYGTTGNDTIFALGGDDEIQTGQGTDNVFAGGGNDDVYTGSGVDNVEGEKGDDFIMGGTENDTINGGSGDDIIRGEEGNDKLTSFAGTGVNDGSDELYGGDGNDTLNGGEGGDQVEGQFGDDTLDSHEVNPVRDNLVGGQGKDKFATKDTIEHNSVNRDDVQVDHFDFDPINKNAADTFH